jgi:hypothetical protein
LNFCLCQAGAEKFVQVRQQAEERKYLEGSAREASDRRMVSSGMLRRVALVRTDVSEEPIASFIRVTTISELGTTLAVTSR